MLRGPSRRVTESQDGPSTGSGRDTGQRRAARAADRGRRPVGLAGGRAGSAAPVRLGVPHPARLRRGRGPGRDQGGGAARRPRGGHPRRLPDAADERHRVPRGGHGPRAAGAPGLAHRVRRHQRRDLGDQRRRRGPLPAQAVGAAGGEALPGGRRPARLLAPRGTHPGAQDQDPGSPVVGRLVRGAGLPGPQPGAVPLVPHRRAGRRSASSPPRTPTPPRPRS